MVHSVEVVFLFLLLVVVVLAALARKLDTPYPIVLVLAGLVLGVLPAVPRITLDPDIVFLVVLPPLLYSSAWQMPWREFRANIVSISMLASGLVVFTTLGMAAAAHYFLPGLDWQVGLLLGAVVSTTDAIAATSIARSLGLPRRMVDILEGESLLNDATGLLLLEFAVAIVAYNRTPSVAEGILRFVWLAGGGLLIGYLVGLLVDWFERMLDDGPIEIALSLMVPYAAYLSAERAHASGVLAVVSCGLLLSRRSAHFFSPGVRLQAWAVWEALTFILNGLVFALIGLQLPMVRESIRDQGLWDLVRMGAAVSLAVILLRLAWMFPGAWAAKTIRQWLSGHREKTPPARQIFVVGWTGMRGVVSLAAALSLPTALPGRNLILFLTFCVILVTLVVQGLSLPWIIRRLGLAAARGEDCEEVEARRLVTESALEFLQGHRKAGDENLEAFYEDLAHHYRERLDSLAGRRDGSRATHVNQQKLRQQLLRVERQTAIQLRDVGRINDEVLRRLERELDLIEARLDLLE